MKNVAPKPRQTFPPKPRRIPERKRMTIALGILASDGVVVAADSQETVQGYWKRREGKIAAISTREGSVLVSGAGRAGYADSLGQAILELFLDAPDWSDGKLEQSIARLLLDFHQRHVAPYADLPEVQMLIAWQRRSEKLGRLLATDRSAIVDAGIHKGQVSIGVGAGHVQPMLDRLHDAFRSADVMTKAVLAAYCVFHAKQSVDGCGHLTQVTYITDGKLNGLSRPYVRALESAFEAYSESVDRDVTRFLLGYGDDKNMKEMVHCLRGKTPIR